MMQMACQLLALGGWVWGAGAPRGCRGRLLGRGGCSSCSRCPCAKRPPDKVSLTKTLLVHTGAHITGSYPDSLAASTCTHEQAEFASKNSALGTPHSGLISASHLALLTYCSRHLL